MSDAIDAGQTLTALELDPGEEVCLRLAGGAEKRVRLKHAGAQVVRRGPLPYADREGVILYRMHAQLEVDGCHVHLARSVPSQENFRDPPRACGLRVWLDAVDDIFGFLNEQHGACRPAKRCRLAVWDAAGRICPPLLHPWCPLPPTTLRVDDCYRGEDTWLGPYDGEDAHGGLDINHPAGTPLWTPLRMDEHGLFDRVGVDGANNNRWRGLHHWPDGSTWVLQAHHMTRLLVPEDAPIEAGVHFAEGAGVLSGAHEHSHFVFRVRDRGEEVSLDPWLLFWQMYRDRAATAAGPPI